jgi:hypothetical protein
MILEWHDRMLKVPESTVEDAAVSWFEQLGHAVAYAPGSILDDPVEL